MPLLMLLALPLCVVVLALRNHRQAVTRGEDLGVVGLAVRMWAYGKVLGPLVLALSFLAYLIGAICFLDGPPPPRHPW
jgi:hypothetical protein